MSLSKYLSSLISGSNAATATPAQVAAPEPAAASSTDAVPLPQATPAVPEKQPAPLARPGVNFGVPGAAAAPTFSYKAVVNTPVTYQTAPPQPASPPDLLARAVGFHKQGQWEQAEQLYQQILQTQPQNADALQYLGMLATQRRNTDLALDFFERALAIQPNHFAALSNMGKLLCDNLQFEPSLALFDRALQVQPQNALLWNNRANALRHLGRIEEALSALGCAAELAPYNADIRDLQSSLLLFMGRTEEARAVFDTLIAVDPANPVHRLKQAVGWVPAVRSHAGAALAQDRAAFAQGLAAIEHQFTPAPALEMLQLLSIPLPYYLAYQPLNNQPLLTQYGAICERLMQAWANQVGLPECAPVRVPGPRKPRIGIVSGHISNHPVWNAIVRGWVTELDLEKFELWIFHLGSRNDAETELAMARAHQFIAAEFDVPTWVQTIRNAELDILLYPELGMDTATARLAALRLAPVQMASWGHPETTGLSTIDYYLSAERFESLHSDAYYREKLVRLPNLGCFVEPVTVAPEPVNLAELGLDPQAVVFTCAGTPFKYTPENDQLLVDIAKNVPNAQFLFFRDPKSAALIEFVLERLRKAFREQGLEPDRHLVLGPWLSTPRFYSVLCQADVFLDTVGFSGFNTVMHAINCALPVVTIRGEFMRGRLGSGILEHIGLQEWVCTSPADYVARATELALSPALRQSWRRQIEQNRHALYHDRRPMEAMEKLLLDALAK